MTDRLLRKCDIAAMLGTSPGVAASVLMKHGCNPVDFGKGRSRGPRWLESAVKTAIFAMHMASQSKAPIARKKKKKPDVTIPCNLAKASASELFPALTNGHIVQ